MTNRPNSEVERMFKEASDYARKTPSDLTAADIAEGRVGPVFRSPRLRRLPPARVTVPLVALALSAVLVVALVVATSGGPATKRTKLPVSPAPTTTTTEPSKRVFSQAFDSPQLTVTASGVYLAWWTSPLAKGVRTELARVDVATGRILARRNLGAVYFDEALSATGSLWVTTTTPISPGTERLLRLDPSSLTVEGSWPVGQEGFEGNNLALAGGALWVDGANRLFRFSLQQDRVTKGISLGRAASSTVAASGSGDMLVIGEADSGGQGAVERRDPVTGRLLAFYPVLGVAAPRVQVYDDSAAWVSESTGMMGYAKLLSPARLTPRGACKEGKSTRTCVEGTNAVDARVMDDELWVTDPPSGRSGNYCADPGTGKLLAAIPFPNPYEDRLLIASGYQLFYAAPGPRGDEFVEHEAIPSACVSR